MEIDALPQAAAACFGKLSGAQRAFAVFAYANASQVWAIAQSSSAKPFAAACKNRFSVHSRAGVTKVAADAKYETLENVLILPASFISGAMSASPSGRPWRNSVRGGLLALRN